MYIEPSDSDDDDNDDESYGPAEADERQSVFIGPNDIHPNMEQNSDDIDQLRLLAGKLSTEWQPGSMAAPALLRYVTA